MHKPKPAHHAQTVRTVWATMTTPPSSHHDSPFPSLLHNDKWQWPWLPLMTMTTSLHHLTTTNGNGQQQQQFPLHHFMTYDNPFFFLIDPLHYFTTYNDFSPSPHNLPFPFPVSSHDAFSCQWDKRLVSSETRFTWMSHSNTSPGWCGHDSPL